MAEITSVYLAISSCACETQGPTRSECYWVAWELHVALTLNRRRGISSDRFEPHQVPLDVALISNFQCSKFLQISWQMQRNVENCCLTQSWGWLSVWSTLRARALSVIARGKRRYYQFTELRRCFSGVSKTRKKDQSDAVSYTHLTLPTIYSV